jgi:hypothetical protein
MTMMMMMMMMMMLLLLLLLLIMMTTAEMQIKATENGHEIMIIFFKSKYNT